MTAPRRSSRRGLVLLAGVLLGPALAACAPQKSTLKPIVDVTSPDGKVVGSRAEAYLGESDGFTQAESACFVERLEAAGIPEYQFHDPPTQDLHEQVLTIMRDCIMSVAATSTTTTAQAAVSTAPGMSTSTVGAVPTTAAPQAAP